MAFIDSILNFIITYKWVLLFYVIIAVIVILNKKKFQVESKFILMYRSQYGIDWINKFADKNREFVKIVGYSAIGVGFVGMLIISGFLIRGVYELIFVPSAPPTMSLVIPGIQIPGSPIFIPFWYGIISLFIVVLFHEFGHGIIARSHGLKIKSTGIVFFGPLIGAFVEPDEKQLVKQSSPIQNSIFAAGPFFNVILAVFVALILTLLLNPFVDPNNNLSIAQDNPKFPSMVYVEGFSFSGTQANFPAEKYGLKKDITYTKINDIPIKSDTDLINILYCSKPNETLVISNSNSSVKVVTAANPNDKNKGYLGITGVATKYTLKSHDPVFEASYNILYVIKKLLEWIFMLSLGIGLANLLPLGPVDGGRMLNISLIDIKGKEKGTRWWVNISIITLIVMIMLIFIPIIKTVFFKM